MKFSKLSAAVAMLWKAKIIWRKPRPAKVLIYDRSGSALILEYVHKNYVEIIDIRGESINLYVLIKCVASFNISSLEYVNKYIACVKPAVVITFIDNSKTFYKIKNSHPTITTVFLQNGRRTKSRDIFGVLEKELPLTRYDVDYMLTFGRAVGNKYSEYINGKVLPVGSIKNNFVVNANCLKRKSIVFISQFRPPTTAPFVFLHDSNRWSSWEEFYSAEIRLLPFILKFCTKENFSFRVAGAMSNHKLELEILTSILGREGWEYSPRFGVYDSYQKVDCSEIVVGVDSTLANEALARGKKTGVFSIRKDILHEPSEGFGWPAPLPDSGPFWTNHADEREFKRVLDYLTTVSDVDWEKTRQQYVPNLIEYDPGNTRFIALLQALDVQLSDQYATHIQ